MSARSEPTPEPLIHRRASLEIDGFARRAVSADPRGLRAHSFRRRTVRRRKENKMLIMDESDRALLARMIEEDVRKAVREFHDRATDLLVSSGGGMDPRLALAVAESALFGARLRRLG